jgi:enoyl-CoA hydratase
MNQDQADPGFTIRRDGSVFFTTLSSEDGLNRLTPPKIRLLTEEILNLHASSFPVLPLVLSGFGNFSAGADLNDVRNLTAVDALEFARAGQALMKAVDEYPALVVAAITGNCLGGGLDLALACDIRIAHPQAVLGHRGAALGLVTGWGGTQRLSRLIGPARALEMFVCAKKLTASQAWELGLVDRIAEEPVAAALSLASSPIWQKLARRDHHA